MITEELRDWFAGMAMQAWAGNMGSWNTPAELASKAYLIADAMLDERSLENTKLKEATDKADAASGVVYTEK